MYETRSGVLPAFTEAQVVSRFMQRVYGWMAAGLLLTAFIAWQVASSQELLRVIVFNPPIFYGLIIAELAIVFGMSALSGRLSAMVIAGCFIVYSILNGLTLSVIFLAYTMTSISQTFIISAGMFGGMSVYGFITKRDLTSVGNFMIMGLWGIILASIINLFFHSEPMAYLISFLAVFIFLGLTAYDTQKLKRIALTSGDEESESLMKVTIFGALTLYLDFINIFLHLLRLLGNRK